jgi:hypothetical protein
MNSAGHDNCLKSAKLYDKKSAIYKTFGFLLLYMNCKRIGGTLPLFFLFLLLSSRHTIFIYTTRRVPLLLSSLLSARQRASSGVLSRDSNSGLPYSKPARYYLSRAAPCLSHAAPCLSHGAPYLSHAAPFIILLLIQYKKSRVHAVALYKRMYDTRQVTLTYESTKETQ